MNSCPNNKRKPASGLSLKKMCLVFLVCGIFLQAMFPRLTVYGSDGSQPAQTLNPAPGGDMKDYHPEKDGYFAYLPVRYEEPGSAVTEDGKTYTDILLPVAVIQKHVLVDLDFFQGITGCEVTRSPLASGEQRAWISVFKRHAVLTERREELLYYLGNDTYNVRWIDKASFELGTPPKVIDGDLYVPLLDLLAILQIPYEFFDTEKTQMYAKRSNRYLQIDQPWKNVYDVLAEIKDDDSPFSFSYGDADLRPILALAHVGTTVHEMLEFDPYAWISTVGMGSMVFKKQGQQLHDNKWCDELTKTILTMYEEEEKFLDEINARNGIQLVQLTMKGMLKSKKAKAAEIYREALEYNMKQPKSKMRDYVIKSTLLDYEDVCADLADSEQFFNEIDKKLSTTSKIQLTLQIIVDLIGTNIIYNKRDKIVSNGIRNLFSNEFQGEYYFYPKYLGKENLGRVGENVSSMEKGSLGVFLYSAREVLCRNAKEIVTEAFGLDEHPFFFVYKVLVKHLPFIKNPLNSMDHLILSDYAVHFQYDTRNAVQKCLKRLNLSSSSEEEILDCIEIAYLYLKCCYVARDSAMKAIIARNWTKKDEDLDPLKRKNRTIARNLAVLSDGYHKGTDGSEPVLPPTASDLHKELSEKKTEEDLLSLLIPMYVKVYGKVRQKTDKEKPVEDADCWVTYKGENVGAFSGTEKGDFSVYIPLPIPKEIKTDMSVLERRDISMGFSSPTIRGNATVELAVEPGENVNAGIVYLGGNIIQGIILDTDTGFPIPGVEVVIVDKTHPALSWTEYTDENGRYSFVDIPEGKYKMLLTKEDYEYGSLEFDADSASEICEMEDIYMDYISGLNVYYPPNQQKDFDGHSYLLVYETNNLWQDVTWRQAAAASRELGGHLVTITSESEQKFVGELYAGAADIHEYLGGFEAWIGAVKKDRDSSWRWVTGEDFSYSQEVEQDLPDADPKGLFYMEMKGPSMYFTSYEDPFNNWYASDGSKEDHPHFFIVEWDN